jgi:hypothetical protein
VRRTLIQAVAQLFTGLEEWDVLLGHAHAVAGTRVAADAGVSALDRECPKPAQLDTVTTRERRRDLLKNRGDDDLDVALI